MTPTYDALAKLSRIAARLHAAAGAPPIPALWCLTDPVRTPDPIAIAERLPRGAGVVLRHFGRPDVIAQAPSLAAVARRRGLRLIVSADPDLARAIGADGVHAPERRHSLLRHARRRQWILTAAAHDVRAARRAAAAGADAVFVSSVFPSDSPSARRPLGPARFAAIARTTNAPVIALGGVDARSAARLMGVGAAGLAGVGVFADANR